MVRPGKTAPAKTGGFHAEVTPIFLHQNVGRYFGSAEEAVYCLIDGHGFRNSVGGIGMVGSNLPACLVFHERKVVG